MEKERSGITFLTELYYLSCILSVFAVGSYAAPCIATVPPLNFLILLSLKQKMPFTLDS